MCSNQSWITGVVSRSRISFMISLHLSWKLKKIKVKLLIRHAVISRKKGLSLHREMYELIWYYFSLIWSIQFSKLIKYIYSQFTFHVLNLGAPWNDWGARGLILIKILEWNIITKVKQQRKKMDILKARCWIKLTLCSLSRAKVYFFLVILKNTFSFSQSTKLGLQQIIQNYQPNEEPEKRKMKKMKCIFTNLPERASEDCSH